MVGNKGKTWAGVLLLAATAYLLFRTGRPEEALQALGVALGLLGIRAAVGRGLQ